MPIRETAEQNSLVRKHSPVLDLGRDAHVNSVSATVHNAKKEMDYNAAPCFGQPLRWQQDNDDESAWIKHSHNPFFVSALDGSEDEYGNHYLGAAMHDC